MAGKKARGHPSAYQSLLEQLDFPEGGCWLDELPVSEHWPTAFSLPDSPPEQRNLFNSSPAGRGKSFNRERPGADYYLRPLFGAGLPGTEALRRHVHEKYRRNCTPNTLLSTVSSGKLFLGYLKQAGKEELHQIMRADLEAFVEREQDRGMKPATVRTRLANIQAFLVFLIREGIVDREVLERTIQVKVPDSAPPWLFPASSGG